jgi:hypothetical protein
MGNLNIATDNDCTNIVPVHFTYVTATTSTKIKKTLDRACYSTNYNQIQSLGVGQSIQNIEFKVNQLAQANTYYQYGIGQILVNSKEFVDKMTHYRYFKLEGLVVVFEPSYIGTGGEQIYVQMNWNSNEVENILNEDSTKIVPFYRTKRITLKYKIPNLNVRDEHGYLNMSHWLTRDIYNLNESIPGNLIFYSNTGAQYAILSRIIIRVAFRGSVNVESTALKKQLEMYQKIDENKTKMEMQNNKNEMKLIIQPLQFKTEIKEEVNALQNSQVSKRK